MPALGKSKHLDEWKTVIDGDGVITYQNGNTRFKASASSGSRAYIKQRLVARPGDKVTLKCLGRVVSGTPALSIDYPATGQQKNEITMEGSDWKEYELNYEVPYTADTSSDYVQVTVGLFTSDAGECDVVLPSISVEPNVNGFLRTYGAGLVKVEKVAGVITTAINDNFVRCSLRSTSYAGDTLTLTFDSMPTFTDEFIRPLFFVNMTIESQPDLVPKIGEFLASSGQIKVKFSNGTGSFVDINTVMNNGDAFFLFVEARGY